MASRELAAISRDVRKVGWNKLPTGLERAGLIIVNTKSHLNQQAAKSALKMGKLAKYMECDLYYLIDPTVDEFIDLIRHFITDVSDYLFISMISTKLHHDLVDEPAEFKVKGGSIDPELLFDLLNCKVPESRVCFVLDGVNNPKDWDPAKNGVDRDGVLFMAPYPDPAQASLDQFDSTQESLFGLELAKIIKCDPVIKGKDLANAIAKELQPFGMKVHIASYPPEMATELSFAV